MFYLGVAYMIKQEIVALGKPSCKKSHIVPFRRPPLLNGQKGHICCLRKKNS